MLGKLTLKLINPFIDKLLIQVLTSKYDVNPFLLTTIAQKIPPRAVVEAGMRAETGKALERPIGSPVVFSPWDQLLLNSRQLFKLPTKAITEVNTKTIIGPRCKKPLTLEMPIMITAMSLGGSLSVPIKKAIAMATASVGTCTNTGESNVTPEERKHAKFLIGQYNRAMRLPEENLQQVDAIEIQFGQGAWGGAAEITDKTDAYLRDIWNLKDERDSVVRPRYPSVQSTEDVIALVNRLKEKYDVPVGVKIAGSDFIEYDLRVISQTKADFITIDGAEGGTSGAPPTLEDDMGLPTLHSLVRAVTWLKKHDLKDRYQVLITGGLKTPGEFLKALALGADAVYIGSIALMATLQSQAAKAVPQYPPVQLALYSGRLTKMFEVEKGAYSLANFLKSCNEEMKAAVQVIGKTTLQDLNEEDLVTVDRDLARFTGVRYAGSARED